MQKQTQLLQRLYTNWKSNKNTSIPKNELKTSEQ